MTSDMLIGAVQVLICMLQVRVILGTLQPGQEFREKEAADRPTCHSSGGVASSGMHFGGDIFWRKISPYATTLIAFQTVRVRLSKRFSYIYEL